MAEGNIKCRFCRWTTRKWNRDDENSTKAFAWLSAHLWEEHPEEAERIAGASGDIEAEDEQEED